MIKIKSVSKYFGEKAALKNISLEIADGETLAIIGGSGSSKATTKTVVSAIIVIFILNALLTFIICGD